MTPAQTGASVPYLRVTATRAVAPLRAGVTTIGRGSFTDIVLDGPGVSVLHAEITRRGPCAYPTDLGSRNQPEGIPPMTTATATEAGVTDAELAVMRQAAARVTAQPGQTQREDPFAALARPFVPPPPDTRAGYTKCCNGAHHFCATLSHDA